MITDLVSTMKALREKLSMTQEEFARLLGIAAVTVARWEEKRSRPTTTHMRRLAMLEQTVNALEEVMTPEYIALWLRTPHPGLGHHTPLDLLDEDFGFKEIRKLVESTKQGTFS